MSKLYGAVAVLATACWVLPGAQAQVVVPLANGNASFEDNFVPDGEFSGPQPAGWALYDPDGLVQPGIPGSGINAVGVLNPTDTSFFMPGSVPDGSNVALIYLEQQAGTTTAGSLVGLAQSFAGVLLAHTRYTLSVGVGNIGSGTGLGASAGFGFADLSGFPGYRVELLAGGQVIAFDDNSLGANIAEQSFQTSSVDFTVGASHPMAGSVLGVRLINLNATGNLSERAREVDFDDVRLIATAVPEPQEYALLLGGLAVLLWRYGRNGRYGSKDRASRRATNAS